MTVAKRKLESDDQWMTQLEFGGYYRVFSRVEWQVYDRTLTCRITPVRPGFHSFRTEFSLDAGATWSQDSVSDAWVMVDPPQLDGLRMYSMVPTASGTIADWKTDLNRIRSMGFNAVHVLPITARDASQSPYAAKDLFSIDPSYMIEGAPLDGLSQIEGFIEHAASLGIRLCFDLVLNHVGVTSAMVERAPDWIVPDENQPDRLKRAGFWDTGIWRTWNDLVLINYEHPSETVRSEIWDYMTAYALFWAKYASDTGGLVRFDNLHSSDPRFMLSVADAMYAAYPGVGILAEYFTDDDTLINTVPEWGLNLLLATPWGYKFTPQLRDYLKYIHRMSGHVRFFMPVTSHDSGSPAQEFGSVDSTVPRYVAAALLGTGATGMPQGVEYAESRRLEFIGAACKIEFPPVARFGEFITRVNAILAENAAFRCGENCHFVDDAHPAVIAAFRDSADPGGAGFLVACNFDIYNTQHIVADLTQFLGSHGPFECIELLSGQSRSYAESRVEIALEPCGAQVLEFPRTED